MQLEDFIYHNSDFKLPSFAEMADHREQSFGAEGEAASGLPSLPRSPSPGAKLPSPTPSDELRRLADPVNTSVFAAAEAVTQTGAATAAEGSSSPDFYEDVNREFPLEISRSCLTRSPRYLMKTWPPSSLPWTIMGWREESPFCRCTTAF